VGVIRISRYSNGKAQRDRMELLSNLKTNSRLSIFNIGKKLGCSRQKAWHIMQELEENNTIWGYTVVIDELKCDKQHFIILIKRSGEIIDHSESRVLLSEDFSRFLNDDIDIETFMCLYGEFDWLIALNASNVLSVKTFVDHLKNDFGACPRINITKN
jgi:DNA-binding Lrp family transcriptional regulator